VVIRAASLFICPDFCPSYQFTCQPLSFDFTLAAAYPFYSHPAFDPIKAYDREQLKGHRQVSGFRNRIRQ